MTNYLELKNITAGYGGEAILEDFSLAVEPGELIALLGASGCGKTTALKIIAGLLESDAGEIILDGANITDLPAEKREIAMVFQKPLLFPFLNVAENVGFGLKMRKLPAEIIREKVAAALRSVHLENFADRLPKQLSGGQEQRVALARAIVTDPRVLLLDEPFSALDAQLRGEMRNLVGTLQKDLKITTVFVTHDQTEAVALADRIAFLDAGRLAQFAAPHEFFVNPQTIETARFFGWTIVSAHADGDSIISEIGNFPVEFVNKNTLPKKISHFAFHQNQVKLIAADFEFSRNENFVIKGKIERVINLGIKQVFVVKLINGAIIEVESSAFNESEMIRNHQTGQMIELFIPVKSVRYFSE